MLPDEKGKVPLPQKKMIVFELWKNEGVTEIEIKWDEIAVKWVSVGIVVQWWAVLASQV